MGRTFWNADVKTPWLFGAMALLLGAMALLGYCNRSEAATREEFKAQAEHIYQSIEAFVRENTSCKATKRHWRFNEPNQKQVFLFVKCLDTGDDYYLNLRRYTEGERQ